MTITFGSYLTAIRLIETINNYYWMMAIMVDKYQSWWLSLLVTIIVDKY